MFDQITSRPLMNSAQISRSSSPWTISCRFQLFIWSLVWPLLCRWTPKHFNFFRICILRSFGAHVSFSAFVHQRARIMHPWNLTMEAGSCLGDGAIAYNMAPILLRQGATVSQEVYLCTGSHDFLLPGWPLVTASITIGRDVFIGARSFVLPGVTIGDSVLVGACSVVTRSFTASQVIAGNPARHIRALHT